MPQRLRRDCHVEDSKMQVDLLHDWLRNLTDSNWRLLGASMVTGYFMWPPPVMLVGL